LTEVPADPISEFQSYHHVRHNQRRLEHLATLGLELASRTVIELGAGIGDHTGFFLDRDYSVLTSDGRKENYEILRRRWSWIDVRLLDLDNPDSDFHEVAEVVYCYGTLYHLSRPAEALAQMARWCTSLLLLETCVSAGTGEDCVFVDEPEWWHSQSLSGRGARPTRLWVHRRLSELFEYVYMPTTQPWIRNFRRTGRSRSPKAASRARSSSPRGKS
jgi:hypothetical protein